MDGAMVDTPIKRKVKGVFIPVSDVSRARDWYRDILGMNVGDLLFGHLCCISMDEGPDLLLDQKLTPDNAGRGAAKGEYPLFLFATGDINRALDYLRKRGVEIVEYDGNAVQNGQWFNFLDCDGNLLMVCA